MFEPERGRVETFPRLFIGYPDFEDRETVLRQLRSHKFNPALLMGIAVRCSWGAPAVLVCRPLHKGVPFPTVLWLSCPERNRFIGGLEANGGVKSLERHIERCSSRTWIDFNMRYALIRLSLVSSRERAVFRRSSPDAFRSFMLGGVGGTRYNGQIRVKCLHLHVASWLTLRGHPGAPWFTTAMAPFQCMRPCCDIAKIRK
jgi:hypothetical protein